MKLLIVSANYPPRIGGPASSVPELAKRLAEKGHKVEIVTLRFQGFPAREKKKFTVHRVFHFSKKPEKTSTLDNIVSVISMALKVRSLLKKENFDLIHAHDLNLSALAALIGKKMAFKSIPLITKYTGDLSLEFLLNYSKEEFSKVSKKYNTTKAKIPPKFKLLDWIQKRLALASTIITCPSEFQQKQLLKHGIPLKKTIVLRNAVDLELFNPKKFQKREEFILYFGRIVSWKGIDYLLEAMYSLKSSHPKTKLKIAGTGKYLPELMKKTQTFGLQKNVEFLGKIEHKKIPALISKSILVAMPSLYDPFPHGMLEVLAMEKPLLATKVCGIPEVIKHKKTGYLVKAGSSTELQKGIKELLANHGLRKKISKNGFKEVHKNYSWKKILKEFLALYESIKSNHCYK